MDDNGETKEDLKVPEDEIGDKMRSLMDSGATVSCTVLKAMGMEKIVDCKSI
jgi:translation initiation factor 5A